MPAAGASLIMFGNTPCMPHPSDQLTLYAPSLYLLDDTRDPEASSCPGVEVTLTVIPFNVPHVETL